MNIREQLLTSHSRENADKITAFVLRSVNHSAAADDPLNEQVVELMACFFSDEIDVAQRAAHAAGLLGREQPVLLKPWWADLVDAAETPVHDAIRRNAIRYFSEQPEHLPKKLEARLIELCSEFVANENVSIAVGAFAMQFVADRSERYPAAAKKLCADLQRRILNASTGFKNRANKVLANLAD